MKSLETLEEYQNFINNNTASLVYFSTPHCNVCKVLKPKLIDFIGKEFPNLKIGYVNSESLPEIAAQNRIFTVPTILIFLESKEFIRRSRNINFIEFQKEIERPYSLLFNT